MKEQSYGIIPVSIKEGKVEVFVVHQYGSAGDTLWTFPKGRGEEGESPAQTALRELTEETGLSVALYDEEKPHSLSYSFTREGEVVEKTTTSFLGIVTSKDFSIQEEEIKEGLWLSPEEAREKLTYPAYKTLLDTALGDLDFLQKKRLIRYVDNTRCIN